MKKNNPNKGFIKEIESRPQATKTSPSFEYKSPIVKPSSSDMGTPKRLANFRSTSEPKSNICDEFSRHNSARRKK